MARNLGPQTRQPHPILLKGCSDMELEKDSTSPRRWLLQNSPLCSHRCIDGILFSAPGVDRNGLHFELSWTTPFPGLTACPRKGSATTWTELLLPWFPLLTQGSGLLTETFFHFSWSFYSEIFQTFIALWDLSSHKPQASPQVSLTWTSAGKGSYESAKCR